MNMIHFDPANPLNWIIGAGLLGLAGVQVWQLTRQRAGSTGRRAVRAAFNGLLWLLLLGYVLQPEWPRPSRPAHALLVADDVPTRVGRRVADSLGVGERLTASRLARQYDLFNRRVDTVTLLGQSFPTPALNRLSRPIVRWVPYDAPGTLQSLNYAGLLPTGDQQTVSGRVQASGRPWLRLRYGNRTLDSLRLRDGSNSFRLGFAAFVRGRTTVALTLDDQPLDTLRFFGLPSRRLTYQILTETPDFESRTLANWLGQQGHSVRLTTTVSTNLRAELTINQPKTPDVFITDPAGANNPAVRRAVAGGKPVLFINLTNPTADVPHINRALGSRFAVKKLPSALGTKRDSQPNVLPYRFDLAAGQLLPAGNTVAVQRVPGLVGVSLLNETFPVQLRGDSVAYGRLWTAVLRAFGPTLPNQPAADAPLFGGTNGTIRVDNRTTQTRTLRLSDDTLRLMPSPVNERSATGTYRFGKTGWLALGDSAECYVADPTANPVGQRRLLSDYGQTRSADERMSRSAPRTTGARLPNWAWLVLFLTVLTALWVEPKIP